MTVAETDSGNTAAKSMKLNLSISGCQWRSSVIGRMQVLGRGFRWQLNEHFAEGEKRKVGSQE